MIEKRILNSKDYQLIEELVDWETKIKDIAWIINSTKAELYAKKCYKKMESGLQMACLDQLPQSHFD
jgi:hypothetical protein